MKKFIVTLLAILFVALITGCSSPSDEHYNPIVIDNTNLLPDSLRQTFNKFQFPKGVLPILVMDGSIGDLLKTGVQADDLFDELEDQYDQYDFDDFGVLIYITQEPQLIQVRLGSFYESFGELCGVTTGYDYFTNQQLYVNGYSNIALKNILESISKNIEERNDLNWWQRGQLLKYRCLLAILWNGLVHQVRISMVQWLQNLFTFASHMEANCLVRGSGVL